MIGDNQVCLDAKTGLVIQCGYSLEYRPYYSSPPVGWKVAARSFGQYIDSFLDFTDPTYGTHVLLPALTGALTANVAGSAASSAAAAAGAPSNTALLPELLRLVVEYHGQLCSYLPPLTKLGDDELSAARDAADEATSIIKELVDQDTGGDSNWPEEWGD